MAPVSAVAAPKNCALGLKRRLSGVPLLNVEQVVAQIESGAWKLERFSNQGVDFVLGKRGYEPYVVRRNPQLMSNVEALTRKLGFDPRTRAERDSAMYLVDRELGLGLVPETRMGLISGGKVSIQVKVKGREFAHEEEFVRLVKETAAGNSAVLLVLKRELEKLAVLDLIGGNMDRNVTSFIYEPAFGKVHAIDNADSFPIMDKNPGMLWFWENIGLGLDEPISTETRGLILSIDEKRLHSLLVQSKLLESEAIEQMLRRVRFLKAKLVSSATLTMEELGKAALLEWVQYVGHRK
ncbi:MAG: hypothetical protein KGP28_10660 [Bdellovibrionales bacterium]|nr:hypothetical protein [Bdellovibrionales bacterium]